MPPYKNVPEANASRTNTVSILTEPKPIPMNIPHVVVNENTIMDVMLTILLALPFTNDEPIDNAAGALCAAMAVKIVKTFCLDFCTPSVKPAKTECTEIAANKMYGLLLLRKSSQV